MKKLIFILLCLPLIFSTCKKEDDTPTYQIGDKAEGGVIVYLDNSGEHGLVADTSNIIARPGGGGRAWGCIGQFIGGTSENIWSGQANTDVIINGCNTSPNMAAIRCDNHSVTQNGVTYNDWFLPSKDELNLLWQNILYDMGGFFNQVNNEKAHVRYYTSSEVNDSNVWTQDLWGGEQEHDFLWGGSKDANNGIIAFREF